jgi:hypothetical protein
MRGKFPDDVSGAAVGSIFTGHESDCTHSGSRNVVGKFTSHAEKNH